MALPLPEDEYWDPYRFYNPSNPDDEEYASSEKYGNVPRTAPAQLTDIPTSSLNAARPRTVAAGYKEGPAGDEKNGTLTVMFRDGTIWNYYNVSPGEWENFHASISKGRPWLNKGGTLYNKSEQGPADLSEIDEGLQEEYYNRARMAQIQFKSDRRYRDRTGSATIHRVGKTAAAKASKINRKDLGVNPARANRAHKPHKPKG